jgi:nucleotide-binding universal stress UspA family protein
MQPWGKRRARRTPYMSIFPTKVLLATDGSEEAELAARSAAELADKIGSELHVVHVFGISPWYPAYPEATGFDGVELEDPVLEEDLQRISEQRARELLDAEAEKLRSVGGTPAQTHLVEGGVPQEIVGLAEEIGAGLVVVGSRGRGGIRRALMGSVSDSVVRHAHCPVLVVRDGERERDYLPGRILLAVDGSEEASTAAQTAVELADRTDSELHVVYVGEVTPVSHPERRGYLARYEQLQEEARRLLEEQVDEIKSAGGTVSRAHLRMGRPDKEIVALGEEIGAGLIATGSRGLGGMRRALMGSASASIVRHAHCPVLVVRPEKEQAV